MSLVPRTGTASVAAALTLALLLTGCAGGEPTAPASTAPGPTTEAAPTTGDRPPGDASPAPSASPTAAPSRPVLADTLDPGEGYALTALAGTVEVLDEPGGEVVHALDNPRDTGAPLTFLLAEDPGDGWYRVHLPVRPNGSTGWVAADDVTVARVPYRLVMDVAANELTLLEGERVLRTMPAASGTGDTPTPTGLFYLTELLEPTNAGYGPFAYGLSAHSEVLTSFGGGPGQIGLHGTDDAASVGRAVSHGCIRLSDDDITYLAGLLPLGTPIEIA
ncbi:L,D-transpeptidase family protein [Aquipuribacter nitratireducens]|uniref:L,D-transpeptidase family protein n=1 Tax=Aquipuribacter nitratireducens TaxID=650104 RepID=A0ABW0GTL0_9MICO